MKNKIGCVLGILVIFIQMPIWYYLMYSILKSVEATQLMWFLFWVYLPLSLGLSILAKFVENILG